jgi:two-component sensor histidine kinase
MFQDRRTRVRSMALIHERLYKEADLAHVNFAEYVETFAHELYRTYKVSLAHIELRVEVDSPALPLSQAIPCGLLMNELISNNLKHGFPNGRNGEIRIALRRTGATTTVVPVADTGVGLPTNFVWRLASSFGLQLIATLVEQLRGQVAWSNDGGPRR